MKDGWELYDESNPEHNDPNLYGVKDYSIGNWISNLNASYKILEFEGKLLN